MLQNEFLIGRVILYCLDVCLGCMGALFGRVGLMDARPEGLSSYNET